MQTYTVEPTILHMSRRFESRLGLVLNQQVTTGTTTVPNALPSQYSGQILTNPSATHQILPTNGRLGTGASQVVDDVVIQGSDDAARGLGVLGIGGQFLRRAVPWLAIPGAINEANQWFGEPSAAGLTEQVMLLESRGSGFQNIGELPLTTGWGGYTPNSSGAAVFYSPSQATTGPQQDTFAQDLEAQRIRQQQTWAADDAQFDAEMEVSGAYWAARSQEPRIDGLTTEVIEPSVLRGGVSTQTGQSAAQATEATYQALLDDAAAANAASSQAQMVIVKVEVEDYSVPGLMQVSGGYNALQQALAEGVITQADLAASNVDMAKLEAHHNSPEMQAARQAEAIEELRRETLTTDPNAEFKTIGMVEATQLRNVLPEALYQPLVSPTGTDFQNQVNAFQWLLENKPEALNRLSEGAQNTADRIADIYGMRSGDSAPLTVEDEPWQEFANPNELPPAPGTATESLPTPAPMVGEPMGDGPSAIPSDAIPEWEPSQTGAVVVPSSGTVADVVTTPAEADPVVGGSNVEHLDPASSPTEVDYTATVGPAATSAVAGIGQHIERFMEGFDYFLGFNQDLAAERSQAADSSEALTDTEETIQLEIEALEDQLADEGGITVNPNVSRPSTLIFGGNNTSSELHIGLDGNTARLRVGNGYGLTYVRDAETGIIESITVDQNGQYVDTINSNSPVFEQVVAGFEQLREQLLPQLPEGTRDLFFDFLSLDAQGVEATPQAPETGGLTTADREELDYQLDFFNRSVDNLGEASVNTTDPGTGGTLQRANIAITDTSFIGNYSALEGEQVPPTLRITDDQYGYVLNLQFDAEGNPVQVTHEPDALFGRDQLTSEIVSTDPADIEAALDIVRTFMTQAIEGEPSLADHPINQVVRVEAPQQQQEGLPFLRGSQRAVLESPPELFNTYIYSVVQDFQFPSIAGIQDAQYKYDPDRRTQSLITQGENNQYSRLTVHLNEDGDAVQASYAASLDDNPNTIVETFTTDPDTIQRAQQTINQIWRSRSSNFTGPSASAAGVQAMAGGNNDTEPSDAQLIHDHQVASEAWMSGYTNEPGNAEDQILDYQVRESERRLRERGIDPTDYSGSQGPRASAGDETPADTQPSTNPLASLGLNNGQFGWGPTSFGPTQFITPALGLGNSGNASAASTEITAAAGGDDDTLLNSEWSSLSNFQPGRVYPIDINFLRDQNRQATTHSNNPVLNAVLGGIAGVALSPLALFGLALGGNDSEEDGISSSSSSLRDQTRFTIDHIDTNSGHLNPYGDFSDTDASGVRVAGVDASSVTIENSNFQDSTWRNSTLEGSTFTDTSFDGANITETTLDGRFEGTTFNGATITDSTISGSFIQGEPSELVINGERWWLPTVTMPTEDNQVRVFQNAILSNVTINATGLDVADFDGATLHNVTLNGRRLPNQGNPGRL